MDENTTLKKHLHYVIIYENRSAVISSQPPNESLQRSCFHRVLAFDNTNAKQQALLDHESPTNVIRTCEFQCKKDSEANRIAFMKKFEGLPQGPAPVQRKPQAAILPVSVTPPATPVQKKRKWTPAVSMKNPARANTVTVFVVAGPPPSNAKSKSPARKGTNTTTTKKKRKAPSKSPARKTATPTKKRKKAATSKSPARKKKTTKSPARKAAKPKKSSSAKAPKKKAKK